MMATFGRGELLFLRGGWHRLIQCRRSAINERKEGIDVDLSPYLKSFHALEGGSFLNNPLFRRNQSAQEVRSVENASTWRRRRQHHPHWHICCPHSNRPHGNGCGQGSCCRDDSSRLSSSRATDHRL